MVDVNKQHAGQLDGLRAIAVIAVVFSHTIPETYAIGRYQFFEAGDFGVSLFFVLSAYLITAQLIAMRRARIAAEDGLAGPLGSFYAKRALRLLPAYYFALFGAVILGLRNIRGEFPWHASMLSEILFALDVDVENMSPAGHFWTLSVEWQFYLLWPLLILTVRERFVPIFIIAVMGISAWTWAPGVVLPPIIDRLNLLQVLDTLMFGAALAWIQAQGWRLGWLKWAGWVGALLFVLRIPSIAMGGDGALDLFWLVSHEGENLAFAALIYSASQAIGGRVGWLLDRPWLQYIGTISYGIYLYHMFILVAYDDKGASHGLPTIPYGIWMTLFIFTLSFVAASLSWHLFELPINRLRIRFSYRPQKRASDTLEPQVPAAGAAVADGPPAIR